jgi:glycerol-3-phosphate dehydrogenase (NAD(P)+)
MSGNTEKDKVLVIGGGNFGTCLAFHLANKGKRVVIFDRSTEVVEAINRDHRNSQYLSQYQLPETIRATSKVSDIDFSKVSHGIIVIPVQAISSALKVFLDSPLKDIPLICASKGIDIKTKMFPLDIIKSVFGPKAHDQGSILSGPSFAAEVMERQPTAVAIASYNPDSALSAQALLHDPFFRIYTSTDPRGLEVAGALKNVVAIAAGMADGLGTGDNTKAAVITRGLAELSRLGEAMGGQFATFAGLAGMGDLLATCMSPHSRNRHVGEQLGRGRTIDEVIDEMNMVAEGVKTSRVVMELAEEYGVEMPIASEVYAVCHEGSTAEAAYRGLIRRQAGGVEHPALHY